MDVRALPSLKIAGTFCYDKTSVYDLVFLESFYFSSLTVTGINKIVTLLQKFHYIIQLHLATQINHI